ncbi:hypothetical protein GGF37_006053, partial [Kickxella alabastrina]
IQPRDLVAGTVNRLQVYLGPTDDILEKKHKKHVDAYYLDKELDLDMRRGWQELTE